MANYSHLRIAQYSESMFGLPDLLRQGILWITGWALYLFKVVNLKYLRPNINQFSFPETRKVNKMQVKEKPTA